jgi:dTDP-4-amino-4,6-dideoxygalactose transaminase
MNNGATRPGNSGPCVDIPLVDLRQQHRALQPRILAALRQVFDSSVFVMGPNVLAFEEEMARFCGVEHAVGVGSGTDALTLALVALGIKPGDEVLVPSFTYAATAAAVAHLGARPVFVDSLPESFNLDPEDTERRITPRTRAIIPVHLFGEAAPMDAILKLARAHDLHVVEDVAQAVGARWGEAVLGSLGNAGCFSFYPTKNLGGCGDGGMVTTNDASLAERIRLIRQQADASVLGGTKYTHAAVGYNSRLDELQAAILRVKLPHLESWNHLRIRHADYYRRQLKDADIGLPAPSPSASHVYSLFTVRCNRRDELRSHLRQRGIGTEIYYPLPLHLQEAYRGLGYHQGDLPVAERISGQVLSIPIYPELTRAQLDRVTDSILEFVGTQSEGVTEQGVRYGL